MVLLDLHKGINKIIPIANIANVVDVGAAGCSEGCCCRRGRRRRRSWRSTARPPRTPAWACRRTTTPTGITDSAYAPTRAHAVGTYLLILNFPFRQTKLSQYKSREHLKRTSGVCRIKIRYLINGMGSWKK